MMPKRPIIYSALLIAGIFLSSCTPEENKGQVQTKESLGLSEALAEQVDNPKACIETVQAFGVRRALPLCEAQAKLGYQDAQMILGRVFSKGLEVPKNPIEAFKWYYMAAQSDQLEAQVIVGLRYLNGKGVEKNDKEAVHWLTLAANREHPIAQSNLGRLYQKGRGVQQDYKTAADWYQKAATQNFGNAQYHLGILHLHGLGVEQSYSEAYQWLQWAAKNNHLAAIHQLGQMFDKGLGVKQDFKQAEKWYLEAANSNHAPSQYHLAMLYDDSFKPDHEKALKKDFVQILEKNEEKLNWLRLAADADYPPAQGTLGQWYYEGKNVSKDQNLGLSWLKRAQKNQDPSAQFYLASLQLTAKNITEIQRKEALQQLEQAIQQGYQPAKILLGKHLYESKNPKAQEKGFSLLEEAATEDNAEAQFLLGNIFLAGKVVPKSLSLAQTWLEKSANQQYLPAILFLGKAYYEDQQFPQDYQEAHKWLTQAALQEDSHAQFLLGKMYESGEGVKTDALKAQSFMMKASNQKHTEAQNWLLSAYKMGKLGKLTTPEARQWLQNTADLGNVQAQYDYALLHYEGTADLPQDLHVAGKYFKMAAALGHPKAAYLLGQMYQEGIFYQKSPQLALKWFEFAALHGEVEAQIALAHLYYLGEGQDKIKAYAFANLAATQNEDAKTLRDKLQTELSPNALSKGQALALEYWEKQKRNNK